MSFRFYFWMLLAFSGFTAFMDQPIPAAIHLVGAVVLLGMGDIRDNL